MLQTVYKKVIVIKNEVLVGTVDGINVTFNTVNNFKLGTLAVFVNGLRQREGSGYDYTVSGLNTIIMENAPLVGDILVAEYTKL